VRLLNINQLLPNLSYGDAVSNSALGISRALSKIGIKNAIYAQHIHPRMRRYAKPATKCPRNQPVIYHMSIGSDLAHSIPEFENTKIMIYHNITPPHFFTGYNPLIEQLCLYGREQLASIKDYFDYAFADSEFNQHELIQLGYSNTAIVPLIFNFDEYRKTPSSDIIEKYKADDGYVNLLFVGRIVPNKRQEDIIKVFYYYKKFINPKSRLFLVGSHNGMERYMHDLKALIESLHLTDVIFTGHVPFDQILAYYRIADLFICMSEHEGFCVPLVEAMFFDLPIIAYNSSAIASTLGSAGFLISEKKDYKAIAELIQIILDDQTIRDRLAHNRRTRLEELSNKNAEQIFLHQIRSIFHMKDE